MAMNGLQGPSAAAAVAASVVLPKGGEGGREGGGEGGRRVEAEECVMGIGSHVTMNSVHA